MGLLYGAPFFERLEQAYEHGQRLAEEIRREMEQKAMPVMRAKFVLMSIKKTHGWNAAELGFSPVTGKEGELDENTSFHKYTPSGSIALVVDNPPLIEKLQLGKSYYVDFTEAPE